MSTTTLSQIVNKLESEIGPDRVRVLRNEALRRGTTLQEVITTSILHYTDMITLTQTPPKQLSEKPKSGPSPEQQEAPKE